MVKIIHSPILNTQILVQIRFPKSRKKRIRAKWAKNRRYFEYRDKDVCIINKLSNEVHVSTCLFKKYKNLMEKIHWSRGEKSYEFSSGDFFPIPSFQL